MDIPMFSEMLQKIFSVTVNWMLGGIGAFLLLISRRSLLRMPVSVLCRRLNLVGQKETSALITPGFFNSSLQLQHSVVKSSSPVLFVGLLDGLALCRLREVLCSTFPKEKLELISSQGLEDPGRAIFALGGVTDNQITAHIIVSSLQRRGIFIRHSVRQAHVLEQIFKVDIAPGGMDSDYGLLVFVKNPSNSKTGCCLALGLHAAGTFAAVKILEDPIRHGLFQILLSRSRFYIIFRLLLDHFGIKKFSELERDWVIVAKCNLTKGIYPGEPRIIYTSEIPPIEPANRGWTRDVRAIFWDNLSEAPQWVGVAGDEPELSTAMVLTWIKKQNFEADTVLDFGCGPGRLFEGYFNQGNPKKIIAMDLSKRMLERAEAHFRQIISSNQKLTPTEFETLHGDDQDLPRMPTGMVDTVICWTILNHIIDDKDCDRVLRNLCRISKNRVIVCDPVCSDDQSGQISDDFPTKRRPSSFYSTIMLDEGYKVNAQIMRFGSPNHPEAERATFVAIKAE